jgi:hypothetical protein
LNQRYDWLPDHHLGVAATLAHVDEVIAQAASILHQYQSQPDGVFQLEEVPVATYSETVVTSISPLPRKVPLLVADALVSLRNAIEHTIFGEIEFREGSLDEEVARLVEMPAALTFDNFQKWIDRRRKNGPQSLQRGGDLVSRIDGLQPYQRTRDPQDHPMALLALHTNYSKHRAPAITAVRLAAIHREDQSPPSRADVQRLPDVPLRVGDVIARTPRGVHVPVALFPTIGINRPGTERWPVLMTELEELSHWVRTQALPRLITGVKPPAPDLPARYDIAIGHEDERQALCGGSMVSAADRHRDRIGAAFARLDMVETLAQMVSAPSREQIIAWLESLRDRELIDRMQRLQIASSHESSILLSNLAVLESMLEDARRFTDASVEPVD